MQSTNIIVARRKKQFSLLVIGENHSYLSKFDTGATNTIVSATILLGDLALEERIKIKEFLNKKTTKMNFVSASGHNIEAFSVIDKNVTVGAHLFEEIFLNIIVDELENNRQLALVGDDFIDCCGLSKRPHGNFVITEFDDEAYLNVKPDTVVSVSEIREYLLSLK